MLRLALSQDISSCVNGEDAYNASLASCGSGECSCVAQLIDTDFVLLLSSIVMLFSWKLIILYVLLMRAPDNCGCALPFLSQRSRGLFVRLDCLRKHMFLV